MIRINLLKPETKEVKKAPPGPAVEVKERKALPVANIVFVVALICLAALFLFQKRALDQEKRRLAAAQEEKQKLAYVIEKLQQLEQQKTIFEKKINLINSLKARQPIAVIVLDEISRCLPDYVWLTELTYDNQRIQIRGQALSNNLIADFIRNLEDSEYLENVDLMSSTQRTTADQTFLEFAMTLRFAMPSPPATSSPPQPTSPAEKEKQS